MRFKQYEKNPFEVIDNKNFDKRMMYEIDIRWNVTPPSGGKKYKLWVLMKKHVEYMIYLFSVMSTDELFKIKQAIEEEIVPSYFKEIVDQFYQVKQRSGFLTAIKLSNGEVFDYVDHESFKIPADTKFNVRQLIRSVPNLKPNIPTATTQQISKLLK